jgi:hypothetical protein
MKTHTHTNLRPVYRRPGSPSAENNGERNYQRPLKLVDIIRRCLLALFLLILITGILLLTWDKIRW